MKEDAALKWIGIAAVLGVLGAGFYYWKHSRAAVPAPGIALPVTGASAPSILYPVSPPGELEDAADYEPKPSGSPLAPRPLPALDESDDAIERQLVRLLGREKLAAFFNLKDIIRRVVSTLDGSTAHGFPQDVSPFKPLAGEFKADAAGSDGFVENPGNFQRYLPYVDLLASVDAKKLVRIYARYYSLFQSAYDDLGTQGYFNDRVVAAIDDALAAPDVHGPIQLIQPTVRFKFADPDLESRSIGQRTLIRIGPENEARVKEKLRQIRGLLVHLGKAG